jgi:adenosylmethionine-8-amino-7-oxononanoate aminotransferase
MEIALKMALRLFHHRHQGVYDANDVFVLSQDDGYHGDTLGS